MRSGDILGTLSVIKSRSLNIFEVVCTGEVSFADGQPQARVDVVEDGSKVWADLLSPLSGAGAAFVRAPRAGEAALMACPRGDVGNGYIVGFITLSGAKAPAEAEWFWRLADGETWRVRAVGGSLVLTAGDAAGVKATLRLDPSGAFELSNAGGAYMRGGAAGVVDLGGAAGSALGVVAELMQALVAATVTPAAPGTPVPLIAPTIPALITRLRAITGG